MVLVKSADASGEKESGFPNDILLRLLEHGMSLVSPVSSATFDRLVAEAMNRYLDVRFYCYRNYG